MYLQRFKARVAVGFNDDTISVFVDYDVPPNIVMHR